MKATTATTTTVCDGNDEGLLNYHLSKVMCVCVCGWEKNKRDTHVHRAYFYLIIRQCILLGKSLILMVYMYFVLILNCQVVCRNYIYYHYSE